MLHWMDYKSLNDLFGSVGSFIILTLLMASTLTVCEHCGMGLIHKVFLKRHFCFNPTDAVFIKILTVINNILLSGICS